MTELKNEIISGRIKCGEFILPENQLSRQYELSRVSIRKALANLVEEGLIEKIPGKGNRVVFSEKISRQTIKLAWFSTSYELDIIQRIITEYEEHNPYVKVDFQILPEVEYVDQLTRQMEQGKGPDLFMVSDSQFRELMEAGKMNLIEPYLSSNLDEDRDSYRQVFGMFSYHGKMVATPLLFSPVVICYNEKIFEETGLNVDSINNWDELLEVAKKCTKDLDGDGLVEQYGFSFSSSYHRWPVFLLQNHGRLMTANRNRFTFADKANVEALQYCIDLMYRYNVSPIFTHGSNQLAEDIFQKERAAMILTTYYYLNEFRGKNIRWDVLPVPKKELPSTLLLGGGLAINKNSKVKAVAQDMIDFMVSKKAQTILKKFGCTIPVLRSVAEDNSLLDDKVHPKNYNAFIEVLPYAHTINELNLTSSEVKLLQSELNLLWANMESPKEACLRIEKMMNQQLAES
ncbi:extracellular solute-binding protein [Pseudalkalibacillus salsuginis]|uniref:extracellular solute-binding protein n=1 Tax=Pseudalkalibacillus salsuginis TaxID=2910972 RepID=UPI001F423EE5|nr:extracellular solute-binding protein [Pseudalkalibacillus salsuginis]